MAPTPGAGQPVACTLDAGTLAERQLTWGELLHESCLGTEPIPRGLRLRLAPAAVLSLETLVQMEAECCPWMHLRIEHGDGHLGLEVTAPSPEGVATIRGWFARPRS